MNNSIKLLPIRLRLPRITTILLSIPSTLRRRTTQTTNPITRQRTNPQLRRLNRRRTSLNEHMRLPTKLTHLTNRITSRMFMNITRRIIKSIHTIRNLTTRIISRISRLITKRFILLIRISLTNRSTIRIILTINVHPLSNRRNLIRNLTRLSLNHSHRINPNHIFKRHRIIILQISNRRRHLVTQRTNLRRYLNLNTSLFIMTITSTLMRRRHRRMTTRLKVINITTRSINDFIRMILRLTLYRTPHKTSSSKHIRLNRRFLRIRKVSLFCNTSTT